MKFMFKDRTYTLPASRGPHLADIQFLYPLDSSSVLLKLSQKVFKEMILQFLQMRNLHGLPNGQSHLAEVDISLRSARVAVESEALEAASAATFGRTLLDMHSMHISSGGTLNSTIGSNHTTTSGIVARVDLP
jgi:hypothetical protein